MYGLKIGSACLLETYLNQDDKGWHNECILYIHQTSVTSDTDSCMDFSSS